MKGKLRDLGLTTFGFSIDELTTTTNVQRISHVSSWLISALYRLPLAKRHFNQVTIAYYWNNILFN